MRNNIIYLPKLMKMIRYQYKEDVIDTFANTTYSVLIRFFAIVPHSFLVRFFNRQLSFQITPMDTHIRPSNFSNFW
jgi:hypothetical protein